VTDADAGKKNGCLFDRQVSLVRQTFRRRRQNSRKGETMHNRGTLYRAALRLSFLVSVLFFSWSWHSAYAAEEPHPCAAEIATYCTGIKPGGGRILKCLKENENSLSPVCREKVASIGKQLKEAQEACAEDINKFCRDIQPGEGRILKCLREHSAEISSGCTEKIEGAKKMIPAGKASGQ
jgi:hypothetical protein